jgi:GT2 family glycosyltransferase
VVASPFGAGGPTTTVIVATYNQQRWLELLLAGLSAQTDPEFDVIVADDGSDPPARGVVDHLRDELPFSVACVAQADEGFRKARIQNLAAARTEADLLIFLDGDCVPYRNLVEVYRRYARPDEFMTGAVSSLGKKLTRDLTPEIVRRGLHEQRIRRREVLRLYSIHLKNLWHRGGKKTRPRIRGANFAVCSSLYRRVDGYDEVFLGYGEEDSDLRNRMRNAGALGVSLWPRARVCHMHRAKPSGKGRFGSAPGIYDKHSERVRARVGLSSHGPEATA